MNHTNNVGTSNAYQQGRSTMKNNNLVQSNSGGNVEQQQRRNATTTALKIFVLLSLISVPASRYISKVSEGTVIVKEKNHPSWKDRGGSNDNLSGSTNRTVSGQTRKPKKDLRDNADDDRLFVCPSSTTNGDPKSDNGNDSAPVHVAYTAGSTYDDGRYGIGDDDESLTTFSDLFLESSQVFRHLPMDGRGRTYEEIKAGMLEWKSSRYAGLPDNATLFELGCGNGVHLYMTLEILHEVHGVQHLTAYGVDYNPRAVRVIETLSSTEGRLPGRGRGGAFCAGSKLENFDYVPSNSFDLVYTGQAPILIDPLDRTKSIETTDVVASMDDLWASYTEDCDGNDARAKERAILAQKLQNDWFGRYVGEMIRVAKPGASIIIEQISHPYVDTPVISVLACITTLLALPKSIPL